MTSVVDARGGSGESEAHRVRGQGCSARAERDGVESGGEGAGRLDGERAVSEDAIEGGVEEPGERGASRGGGLANEARGRERNGRRGRRRGHGVGRGPRGSHAARGVGVSVVGQGEL